MLRRSLVCVHPDGVYCRGGCFTMQGTARRKKKVVHRTATTDDKKLQSVLKKLNTNNIPGVDQVSCRAWKPTRRARCSPTVVGRVVGALALPVAHPRL